MNWEQVEGTWNEIKGAAKQQWAKLTDDDLKAIDGKRDRLVGKLQRTYGYAKERAEEEADKFVADCSAGNSKGAGCC